MQSLCIIDTNDIILLFPQAAVDNTIHKVWDGTPRNNSLGCWDWIGQYGNNTDQIGGKLSPHDDSLLLSPSLMTLYHLGVQMAAIVNQVKRITSGYQGGSTLRVPHSMPCGYLPSRLGYILSCSKYPLDYIQDTADIEQ